MSTEFREVEARGANVEAAIEKGLARLGVGRNDVIVEVLDEGSRGLLGLGSRDAVVRLRALTPPEPQPPRPSREVTKPVEEKPSRPEKEAKPAAPEAAAAPQKQAAKPQPAPEKPETAAVAELDEDEEEEDTYAEAEEGTAEEESERQVAEEIVRTMLDHMQVDATVTTRLSEPDDLTGRRVAIIDVEGDDLGILIGPRGDTLDALQYISRLMVGHRLRQRARFLVDIEGYRRRREQALARLAERMAKKAIERGRPMTLEPMSSYERRIIHMTLRDSDDVYTESTGEGSRRRVRVYPKNGDNNGKK